MPSIEVGTVGGGAVLERARGGGGHDEGDLHATAGGGGADLAFGVDHAVDADGGEEEWGLVLDAKEGGLWKVMRGQSW